MKLAYEAYDRAGRHIRDRIEAADQGEAAEALRRRGLFVATLEDEAGAGAGANRPDRRRRNISRGRRLKHLAVLARQLYILVSTGTPLVESLAAMERQARDESWKRVLTDVRERVEQGCSLHEALSEHSDVFDPITRSLIAAGESAGKLPLMLDRIATLTRKQLHLRGSIIGAMIYPALLLAVAAGVLVLMLVFVLPRFAGLFQTLDVPLPPTTKLLLVVSDLLIGYWWAALLLAGGASCALPAWLRTPPGRRALDTLALRAPQFGRITRSFATARIVRLMGVLLDSYLPLLDVLRLVKDATLNSHYRDLLTRAEDAVARGEPISTAFKDPALIHPSVYEALRSGEASGQVGPLMLNLADCLDEDNDVVVRSLTSIIEPLILIVLGLLVGLVAVSMFLPLFDLTAMTGGGV